MINKKAYEDQFMDFDQFSFGALSVSLFLSHTIGHLEFSWCNLVGVFHTKNFGAIRKKESKKVQEVIKINNYSGFFLQVLSFMYGSLTSFGMHDICMRLFGYDFSMAWGIAWIDSGFA